MVAAGTERTFTCNLCEALCGLRVAVDGNRVLGVRGDPDDVLSGGHVCPKAYALKELYEDPDRLRAPIVRDGSGWRRIPWEEALAQAATRLREVRARHGRDAVAIYVGNPVVHSHRSSLAAQLLTMALGTHNRYDPNSQDSNPRLFACMQVYGDALAIPVPDIERTDFLLMLGANPAVSNGSQIGLGDPRGRFRAIRERGGRVVLIDPRRSESAAWCSEHHFIRPGGDAALLFAMLHVLFAEGLVDVARVADETSGLAELRELAARFSPERVAPAVAIDAATIRSLARDFAGARRACAYSRVGVCQAAFGPLASWLTEALNLVTGNFDREGGALLPTPPADVAPLARSLIGNEWGRWRSRVRALPEFLGALPSAAFAEEIETPGPGQIRALVCLAGNPVLSTPNGARLDRALAGLEYMVAIDFYVNETTRHANLILPTKHVFETGNYDVILSRFAVRNVAKYSPPIVNGDGDGDGDGDDDTRDDWQIACDLAARLAGRLPVLGRAARAAGKRLPELIVDLMLRLGPHRLSLARLREAPHGLDLGPLRPSGGAGVRTPDGRARLAPAALVADVPRLEAWVDAPRNGELVLIGRRQLRSNNSWMHNLPSLAKGPDRTRLFMHPDDAARLGLGDGARVRITSRAGQAETLLSITADMMPGVVSLPHGFGHGAAAATLRVAGALGGPNANALTDELSVEPIIGTSILNGVPVAVEGCDAN